MSELDDLLRELEEREARLCEPGGAARVARHRSLGRMTARERVDRLLDPGTVVVLGEHVLHAHEEEGLAAHRHPGDGVVCGFGKVDGKPVAFVAHEPTILRGAVGITASRTICRVLDAAMSRRLPILTLADSDGVRVEEGIDALDAYGEILKRVARMRGKVPQITVVYGLAVGAAAYGAALNDWVGMVKGQSYLFITGPKVTKAVTGEDVELEALGGASMHSKVTGQCHAILETEEASFAWIRALLRVLDPPRTSDDPIDRPVPELLAIVPTSERRAYDMKKVLNALFDRGSILEVAEGFAKNLITAFARLGGTSVAVVASQPMVLAGSIDVDASRKGARFVRWAGDFGLPVVTLVDVPGFLPGLKQEQGGILPHGATLIDAYANARVPHLCLIVRKSYGGATVLSFPADIRLALPTARVGPVGVDAMLEIAMGPESPEATEEEKQARAARRSEWVAAHGHGWAAAEGGYVDRVVHPSSARAELVRALASLVGAQG